MSWKHGVSVLASLLGLPNEADVVNNHVRRYASDGEPQIDFLKSNISEFISSEEYQTMITGKLYYQNKNDINDREIYHIDRKGRRQRNESVSNNKLSHPFMKKLVNQKVNYIFSKDFSLLCDNKQFLDDIKPYTGTKFKKLLKNTAKDAITCGIAWLQVYYDAESNLKFKRISPLEVIPFWADSEHTELDALIRFYETKLYKGNKVIPVQNIEFYTPEGVWYYELYEGQTTSRLVKVAGHFSVKDGEEVKQMNWAKIPFIPFKYNPEEISLIKWVKPLIDDYDLNTSNVSNEISDSPNRIKVVRNYDGTDKNQFSENLSVFRTVFVANDGGVDTLDNSINTESIEAHLSRLRNDIYESGGGVDNQKQDLGNASGVALRFRYADLDMDAEDLTSEFSTSVDSLFEFIILDLLNTKSVDYTDVEYSIVFNTDTIINESETIQNCLASKGIISNRTIQGNHPWVLDVEKENEQMLEDDQEELDYLEDEASIYEKMNYGGQNSNSSMQTGD